MKTIKTMSVLVILSAFLTTGCVTQKHIPSEETIVISAAGQSKKTIFHKARQWFSEYFVSGKSVVDYEDKEAGTIIAKGTARIGSDPFGIIGHHMKFSIRIDVKDGKFRALTRIISHYDVSSTVYDVTFISEERKKSAENYVEKIAKDIGAYINSKNNAKQSW